MPSFIVNSEPRSKVARRFSRRIGAEQQARMRRVTDKSESPSFKNDGISPQKKHLPRSQVIQAIYDTALEKQHVVLGSSAATGKTSLLQLLEKRLMEEEEEGASAIRINMNSTDTADSLLQQLAEEGICKEVKKLRSLEKTWLLLDDAQNAYDRKFDPFWHFVVKEIAGACVEDNSFVVVAANPAVENLPSDPDVTGELDFYVNGKLKWCLELLRNGKGVGEHIGRFDLNNGKYRKVTMNDYIIVDCRGPKIGGGVKPSESRCTLYFAEDFKHCICQMRTKGTFRIELAN